MAKQVLDGPDVDPAFQEVGGEGMPKGVAGRGFGEPGFAHGVSELALHGDFVNVVSGDPASFRVRTKRRRWKEKLPGPFAGGVGVFSHEGFGHVNVTAAASHKAKTGAIHELGGEFPGICC